MWRHLAARGLWPGPEPVWHTRDGRDGTLAWDWHKQPLPRWPTVPPIEGIVVLAGATAGSAVDLGIRNMDAALAAQWFGREQGLEPILLCSSAAVYGHGDGPHHEDDPPEPASDYGWAKLGVEDTVVVISEGRSSPRTCALRIGNVAGADALFGAMAAGPVTLDRLPDGTSPRRAYIGPLTLARAMVALLARDDLPPLLNLAQPGLVAMSDVLAAAGLPWTWRDALGALPSLEMDLTRLQALAALPPATAEGLVTEARLAGWAPHGVPAP